MKIGRMTTSFFICSDNYFGDFRITKKDFPFLTKDESFVSCSSPVFLTIHQFCEG
jgi:hypothetical protein